MAPPSGLCSRLTPFQCLAPLRRLFFWLLGRLVRSERPFSGNHLSRRRSIRFDERPRRPRITNSHSRQVLFRWYGINQRPVLVRVRWRGVFNGIRLARLFSGRLARLNGFFCHAQSTLSWPFPFLCSSADAGQQRLATRFGQTIIRSRGSARSTVRVSDPFAFQRSREMRGREPFSSVTPRQSIAPAGGAFWSDLRIQSSDYATH